MPETHFLQGEILSDPLFAARDINAALEAWRKGTSLLSEPNPAQVERLSSRYVNSLRTQRIWQTFSCPVGVMLPSG